MQRSETTSYTRGYKRSLLENGILDSDHSEQVEVTSV